MNKILHAVTSPGPQPDLTPVRAATALRLSNVALSDRADGPALLMDLHVASGVSLLGPGQQRLRVDTALRLAQTALARHHGGGRGDLSRLAEGIARQIMTTGLARSIHVSLSRADEHGSADLGGPQPALGETVPDLG